MSASNWGCCVGLSPTKGVTADPATPAIKHREAEAKVTVKAADDPPSAT